MGKPAGIVVMDETENRSMEETAMTRKLLLPLLSLLLALCFAVPALADSDFVFDSEFKIPMIAGGNHTLIICHETISLLTTFVHSHNVQHRFL